jgi:hypothetical protein
MTTTGVFNVQDYGAVGDGVHNDYDAFAEVLATMGPHSHDAADIGGVIWVPPVAKSYYIDASKGPLSIPPGVTLMGVVARYRGSRITHGKGGVLFDCFEGNEARRIQGLVIRGGAQGAIGIRVRANLTKLDQIAFDRWTGASCIEFSDYTVTDPASRRQDLRDGPWNCHASNVTIECWDGSPPTGSIDYGIRCRGSWNASSITHSSIAGARIAGIAVEGGAGSAIRVCNVEHNEAASDSVGILVGGSGVPSALTIDAIESESNYSAAIRVTHVEGLILANIYDNPHGYHRLAPYSIDINDSSGSGANVRGVSIIGGSMSGAATAGIRIAGTKDVALVGVPESTAVAGIGNFRVTGTMNVSSSVTAAGGFKTATGAPAVATDTWTTIFTADQQGIYFAYANHLDAADGKAMFIVVADRSSAREAFASNGTALQLRLSGSDVQVRHSYGSRLAIRWGFLLSPIT